jgi:hypothetical protein
MNLIKMGINIQNVFCKCFRRYKIGNIIFINIAQIPIISISLQWLLDTYDFSLPSGGRDSITDKQAFYSYIFLGKNPHVLVV